MTLIAALDAFYDWERQQKPRWRSLVSAMIACVASSLIITSLELLAWRGELAAGFAEKIAIICAPVLATALFAGLAVEWFEKREQGVDV